MSLIPILKKSMQELHDIAAEERRCQRVKEIITQIYTNAINAAKNNLKSYSECICNCGTIRYISTIEIAKGIQALFPDCTILIRPSRSRIPAVVAKGFDIIPLTYPGLMRSTLADTSILVYEFPQRIVEGIIHSQAYDLYIDWS